MKSDIYSTSGEVVGQIELADAVFGSNVNDILIYELIKSANANLRQGTSKTKERSDVRGGGAKPWKQKGTGRARAGSSRSPLWVGGGTVFGPKPRSYEISMPKKMKKAAYCSLFSLKVKEGKIKIVEDFEVSGKTKDMVTIGKALDVTKGVLISGNESGLIKRAMRNIPWFVYNNANRVSSRDIFYADDVIIMKSAVQVFNEKYNQEK